jgi:hypothetical protein
MIIKPFTLVAGFTSHHITLETEEYEETVALFKFLYPKYNEEFFVNIQPYLKTGVVYNSHDLAGMIDADTLHLFDALTVLAHRYETIDIVVSNRTTIMIDSFECDDGYEINIAMKYIRGEIYEVRTFYNDVEIWYPRDEWIDPAQKMAMWKQDGAALLGAKMDIQRELDNLRSKK